MCHRSPKELSFMPDLTPEFEALCAVLRPYAQGLDVKRDDPRELYVDTRHLQANKKPLFFAAVQLKKSQVSFHLMPVYLDPGLLVGMSDGLKAGMHGKSCFNFSRLDAALVQELAGLVAAGHASFQAQGFVQPLQ
jgi:hypothetical protein